MLNLPPHPLPFAHTAVGRLRSQQETKIMANSAPWNKHHKRNLSRESVLSNSSDCYSINSILETPAMQPSASEGPRRRRAISTSRSPKSNRRGRKPGRGSGTVANTILGPAAALMGGRQEWAKMKQSVRSVAAEEAPSMPIHTSELV